MGYSGVFGGDADFFKGVEGNAEDYEVVDHVGNDVYEDVNLGGEGGEVVDFEDFGEGLGDTDGAGKFDDVDGEGDADDAESGDEGEWLGGELANSSRGLLLLL